MQTSLSIEEFLSPLGSYARGTLWASSFITMTLRRYNRQRERIFTTLQVEML
jgi:hypothetical protein